MEDNHIRLTQIGRLNKKDDNGIFSSGYSYINPRNILYLEEVRCVEQISYDNLRSLYHKDKKLDKICWWCIQHYIGNDKYTNTQEDLYNYWTEKLKESDSKDRRYCKEDVPVRHTRVNLLTGSSFLVEETPEEVKDMVNKFFKNEEESKKDRIVVTKDDIVKNFIFKNLT